MVFIDMKVKRVVGVFGVVRVAALRFRPANHLAHVFNDGFALRNVLHCEHPLAMHA
jgi:hypothetical protein